MIILFLRVMGRNAERQRTTLPTMTFRWSWDVRQSVSEPAPGGPEHDFPLLSGAGRSVVKDVIILGPAKRRRTQ